MEEIIKRAFEESVAVKRMTFERNVGLIAHAADIICASLEKNGKILFFGNGGSAADSQHVAAEFVGRFMKERKALAAIALTTDTSVITSVGNDYSYDDIFSRQIEALGRKNDVAFGLSTSGNSPNVIKALKKSNELGLNTIALTGSRKGGVGALADIHIKVPAENTARIQESHMCIYHVICELVENSIVTHGHSTDGVSAASQKEFNCLA